MLYPPFYLSPGSLLKCSDWCSDRLSKCQNLSNKYL